MIRNYAIAAVCILLIAGNVAVFIFLPKVIAPLALILSNAITAILMLISAQALNSVIQHELSRRSAELAEKEAKERELEEKVRTLENRNHELESRIDTWKQTGSVPADVSFTFKLETMTFDKSGYIVKEEPLERFINDPAYGLSDRKGLLERLNKWMDDLAHPGAKKVLYIGKFYAKASIGLDFSKIKFSTDGGNLVLFGVKFSKLNDLAIDRDPDEVEHCWLLNEYAEGFTSINQSGVYEEFTEVYSRFREEEAHQAIAAEMDALCEHYTEVFRNNLAERFPGIEFRDHIEDSDATWYSLKEHIQDSRIYPIASNMFLMADVLNGYIEASGIKLLSR